MTLASVRNLRISFDGVPAVDGVSFDISPGECLAIVGESGSGKTLTARSLLGLTPTTARVQVDELTLDGQNVSDHSEAQWRRLRGAAVGLVSQDALSSLDPLRRVGREVAEAAEVHGLGTIGQQVVELLRSVAVPDPGVRARQYPHELSGGLRQRALIASALSAGPKLLVADEPTTALDVTVQAQILRLLNELKASGLGLLLVSHDLAVVAKLADRIAVMKDGVFVETGDTATVLESPQHEYTTLLLSSRPGERVEPNRRDAEVVLAATGIAKSYRRPDHSIQRAITGASLELRAGTTLGIVGESGSGKSTLARILMGLERPDSGEVKLNGESWSVLRESQRRGRRGGIQLIDQDPFGSFDPRFTVGRIVAEAVALDGETGKGQRAERVVELLRQVGLAPALLRRRPRQLSGGQRQRVAIARALARRPRVLVCDEPVSALDVSIQAQVLGLLGSLQSDLGLSMVFISHDLAVIRQLSDDILVMKDGVVVEQGSAASVLTNPRHPFTKELLALTDPEASRAELI
ncbi:MAG: ABC transporter ATP-binding protein [Homoserinimonas sp.]